MCIFVARPHWLEMVLVSVLGVFMYIHMSLKPLRTEFDEKVQQSKDDAEDALEKIPEIEARIEQAEDKTRQAEQNLAGAEADAILARDIAREAEDIAKMASDVST